MGKRRAASAPLKKHAHLAEDASLYKKIPNFSDNRCHLCKQKRGKDASEWYALRANTSKVLCKNCHSKETGPKAALLLASPEKKQNAAGALGLPGSSSPSDGRRLAETASCQNIQGAEKRQISEISFHTTETQAEGQTEGVTGEEESLMQEPRGAAEKQADRRPPNVKASLEGVQGEEEQGGGEQQIAGRPSTEMTGLWGSEEEAERQTDGHPQEEEASTLALGGGAEKQSNGCPPNEKASFEEEGKRHVDVRPSVSVQIRDAEAERQTDGHPQEEETSTWAFKGATEKQSDGHQSETRDSFEKVQGEEEHDDEVQRTPTDKTSNGQTDGHPGDPCALEGAVNTQSDGRQPEAATNDDALGEETAVEAQLPLSKVREEDYMATAVEMESRQDQENEEQQSVTSEQEGDPSDSGKKRKAASAAEEGALAGPRKRAKSGKKRGRPKTSGGKRSPQKDSVNVLPALKASKGGKGSDGVETVCCECGSTRSGRTGQRAWAKGPTGPWCGKCYDRDYAKRQRIKPEKTQRLRSEDVQSKGTQPGKKRQVSPETSGQSAGRKQVAKAPKATPTSFPGSERGGQEAEVPPSHPSGSKKGARKVPLSLESRLCSKCGSSESSKWYHDPDGAKTVCRKCKDREGGPCLYCGATKSCMWYSGPNEETRGACSNCYSRYRRPDSEKKSHLLGQSEKGDSSDVPSLVKPKEGEQQPEARSSVEESELVSADHPKLAGKDLVCHRLAVWWPKDQKYYPGRVKYYDRVIDKYEVLYDDGTREKLDLSKEKWALLRDDVELIYEKEEKGGAAKRGTGSEHEDVSLRLLKAKARPQRRTQSGAKWKRQRESLLEAEDSDLKGGTILIESNGDLELESRRDSKNAHQRMAQSGEDERRECHGGAEVKEDEACRAKLGYEYEGVEVRRMDGESATLQQERLSETEPRNKAGEARNGADEGEEKGTGEGNELFEGIPELHHDSVTEENAAVARRGHMCEGNESRLEDSDGGKVQEMTTALGAGCREDVGRGEESRAQMERTEKEAAGVQHESAASVEEGAGPQQDGDTWHEAADVWDEESGESMDQAKVAPRNLKQEAQEKGNSAGEDGTMTEDVARASEKELLEGGNGACREATAKDLKEAQEKEPGAENKCLEAGSGREGTEKLKADQEDDGSLQAEATGERQLEGGPGLEGASEEKLGAELEGGKATFDGQESREAKAMADPEEKQLEGEERGASVEPASEGEKAPSKQARKRSSVDEKNSDFAEVPSKRSRKRGQENEQALEDKRAAGKKAQKPLVVNIEDSDSEGAPSTKPRKEVSVNAWGRKERLKAGARFRASVNARKGAQTTRGEKEESPAPVELAQVTSAKTPSGPVQSAGAAFESTSSKPARRGRKAAKGPVAAPRCREVTSAKLSEVGGAAHERAEKAPMPEEASQKGGERGAAGTRGGVVEAALLLAGSDPPLGITGTDGASPNGTILPRLEVSTEAIATQLDHSKFPKETQSVISQPGHEALLGVGQHQAAGESEKAPPLEQIGPAEVVGEQSPCEQVERESLYCVKELGLGILSEALLAKAQIRGSDPEHVPLGLPKSRAQLKQSAETSGGKGAAAAWKGKKKMRSVVVGRAAQEGTGSIDHDAEEGEQNGTQVTEGVEGGMGSARQVQPEEGAAEQGTEGENEAAEIGGKSRRTGIEARPQKAPEKSLGAGHETGLDDSKVEGLRTKDSERPSGRQAAQQAAESQQNELQIVKRSRPRSEPDLEAPQPHSNEKSEDAHRPNLVDREEVAQAAGEASGSLEAKPETLQLVPFQQLGAGVMIAQEDSAPQAEVGSLWAAYAKRLAPSEIGSLWAAYKDVLKPVAGPKTESITAHGVHK